MRSSRVWLILLGLLCVLPCVALNAQQYRPALPGYHFEFPRDNFNHPDYQTEWWYYTGNLRGKDGHRFGFELTFFRQGVSKDSGASPWVVRDLYLAHMALSDISGGRYYQTERVNRAGPGIAGIQESSATVWNGNWQATIEPKAHDLRGVGDRFSFELTAVPEKPPTIQGTDGVSQKSEGLGHASHYVSYTRMKTAGSLTLNGTNYLVEGDTWMDHEFFTESVSSDQAGWDWMGLQLSDGSDLMLYRLRHRDGTIDPYSSGTYIDPSGKAMHLTLQDMAVTAQGAFWKSGLTGATYPLAWSVAVPGIGLQLNVTTPLKTQEFVSRIGPSYWEGAVDVSGQHGSAPVQGSGYLELTGYSDHKSPLMPQATR